MCAVLRTNQVRALPRRAHVVLQLTVRKADIQRLPRSDAEASITKPSQRPSPFSPIGTFPPEALVSLPPLHPPPHELSPLSESPPMIHIPGHGRRRRTQPATCSTSSPQTSTPRSRAQPRVSIFTGPIHSLHASHHHLQNTTVAFDSSQLFSARSYVLPSHKRRPPSNDSKPSPPVAAAARLRASRRQRPRTDEEDPAYTYTAIGRGRTGQRRCGPGTSRGFGQVSRAVAVLVRAALRESRDVTDNGRNGGCRERAICRQKCRKAVKNSD